MRAYIIRNMDASRRLFVQGLTLSAAATGLGLLPRMSWGTPRASAAPLSGSDFSLTIGQTPVNITGQERMAITVNGGLPGPLLRWREGDTVNLQVSNRLRQVSSIHWHGILLPANMDGVPGMSFDGIAPGEAYHYRFRLRQAGTYWYHSHSMFQEQAGLYGAIIVDPLQAHPFDYDREHVLLLSDWTDLKPEHLFSRLKKTADYDNRYKRTLVDYARDAKAKGLKAATDERLMWGKMRMTPTDLSDVNGNTYTYLCNGNTPNMNWTGLFKPGEKLLLRFINASAMTHFDVRIPGIKMTVVAADGQAVHVVSIDEFRIAPAETFDVIVETRGQDAYTVFAQDIGRSGYARATLATQLGLAAAIPALDSRPLLSMSDMGHAHGGMSDMDMDMDHGSMNMPTIEHPASEKNNPLVDMQTDAAMPKLDDPGIGLRDNGRKVLTYAMLRSAFNDPDGRDPGRELQLHLTGHMEKFSWSFNGEPFMSAQPLRLNYGERVRITLVNDTMMSHPIHLHGMWSDLEDEQQQFMLRKHTIDMPPGTMRSYRVSADALGRWAYHCHLLYHMEAGMMREVQVMP